MSPPVNGDFYPPEEVSVAINPVNPLNIAASANVRYAYVSGEGGMTWKERLLPPGTWGDPSLTFDGVGTLYYCHLSHYGIIGVPGARFIDRLGVHRSSDGGDRWKDSVIVGYNPPRQQDKDYLAADLTNSPYRNNVYLAWTQFDLLESHAPGDSSRILFSRSTDGGTTWMAPVRVNERAGKPGPSVPSAFALFQNYPNPFNPSTTISYQVPRAADVRLVVCDLLGREVARLFDGPRSVGFYKAIFNASRLSSGVYFCRLTATGYAAQKSMLYLK